MTEHNSPPSARKWQMTRISAGDYLLPSNDGETVWRLSEYVEDGSAEYVGRDGRWRKLTGTFWQTAKYRGRIGVGADEFALPSDFLDWSNWETWETNLPTRRAAVEAALKVAP